MKTIVLIISIMVLFLSQTNAQVFTNYTSMNTSTTLSSGYVTSIVIDADGNLWFGTLQSTYKEGRYFYRYRGVTKLSDDNVSIIPTIEKENHILAYPNPMGESIHIKTSNGETIQRIELIDISGKVVRNVDQINSDQLMLTRKDLNSGIYLLKIYADRLHTSIIIIH